MKSRPSLTVPAPPPGFVSATVSDTQQLAITSYRLLNFPCQVFVFLLSQTPPDPHLHPPHLLCTCPVHCVVLDQLHSGTFLLHTHVFSLTGSTSPPAPCSHYSSQCCLHHRTHEGPQSRVLMSWRPRSKSICPSYSSPVPCCLLHSLSMCSVCAVPQYVSWCPVVCFFHIHTDMIQLLLTFSALPHLHVEPHFSSSFSRCGSSAPSPCGCCSSAP